jgi:hypothetical protein
VGPATAGKCNALRVMNIKTIPAMFGDYDLVIYE